MQENSTDTWAMLGLVYLSFSSYDALLDFIYMRASGTSIQNFAADFGKETTGVKLKKLRALATNDNFFKKLLDEAESIFSDSKRNTFAHGRVFTKPDGGVKIVNPRTYPISGSDVVDLLFPELSLFAVKLSQRIEHFQNLASITDEELVKFVESITA